MLFTRVAMQRFCDATLLMTCIDDLETLYSNGILLWDGLKDGALYNQDWLFCWCLQVRMNGTVYLDNAFEDTFFPQRKCLTLSDVARQTVGVHHVTPRRIHALWNAYQRVAVRREVDTHRLATNEWNAQHDREVGQPSVKGSGRSFSTSGGRLGDDGRSPSRPQKCMLTARGNPYAHLAWEHKQTLRTLPRPV